MTNNIIHLPGNIHASQILYEDNLNIKSKIDDIQTSVVEANDNFNEELENIETQISNKTSELNQKISNIIDTSHTEVQAITHSSTNTNTIYFSTDTNCIIINGEIYGQGQHLNGVFKLIPSNKTIGSTGYNNTDVIYIQLDGTNFTLYYYSINNTWESIRNIAFDTDIDASDISYDISNTPDLGSGDAQSVVEALDAKVEDFRDDMFGDEWVDEIHERRFLSLGSEYGWYRNYSVLRKNSTLAGDWNANVIGFKVRAGDKFRLVGISINTSDNWDYSPMACFYDIYEVPTASGSSPSNYTFPNAQYVGSYSPESNRSIDDIVEIPQGVGMVAFRATKNSVVNSGGYLWYAADDKSYCYRYLGNVLSIADKTGYKINTWTDNEIITSTSLAVGSVVPYWSDGTRYGGRGVRLNVKEGDKVLLDTYSPALFGLIFTDENRVIKALYDDRRFDGIWTAPCNGYCYIQDVLYRDCYYYSSAYRYLAYMAHDARKRVTKGGDWYNEMAPRRTQETLPIEVNKTGNAQTYIVGDDNLASWVGIDVGKFVLIATRVYTYADSAMAGTTLVTAVWHNSTANALQVMSGGSSAYVSDGYNWGYRIYLVKVNTTGQTFYQAYWNTSSTEKNHHRIDKAYMHSFDNFADAYQLAEKIVHGEVEVDNFYGVREKEVDLVKNAIALKSISNLGYNILEHGATLPIDEEGYKYAKEIYERYKDNPPSGQNWNKTNSPFYNNDNTLKLVYLPTIDFSHFKTNGSDYLASAFYGCANLICVGDITLPEECTGTYNNYLNSTFTNCYSLKEIGNITVPMTKICGAYRMCHNCYALEKVGKITSNGMASSSIFQNCYSLERIEEISLKKTPYFAANASPFLNCISLRFMLIKDFGTIAGSGTYVLSATTSWGISNDKHPDARQSLVDSLLTYSYDRINDPDELGTADTTCTITLSANSYNQLTTAEIDAITAKGYTLTHPQ